MANTDQKFNPSIETKGDNNTIHYHVKIDQSQRSGNSRRPEKKEANWALKLIVGGIISVAVAVAIFYLTGESNQGHKPAVIENGAPAISGEKVN